ncbi:MAG: immunity 53 family protein [Paraglaciecola sp.]|uniref:immunity 53 family protein n=1 Tax=Paraglaciecola sp. TaxID=1920173 RepID=UPI003299E872
MEEFAELQKWYQDQCNDDWEHSFGISIDTLDNPGWHLSIDLEDTDLEDKIFDAIEVDHESENDWLVCKVNEKKFIGACAPLVLTKMIKTFVVWANGN